MKTTALKEDWPAYRELLWGPFFSSTDTTIGNIPACFGQIVHLQQYYCQNTDLLAGAPKLPLLPDHINLFQFDQMRGHKLVYYVMDVRTYHTGMEIKLIYYLVIKIMLLQRYICHNVNSIKIHLCVPRDYSLQASQVKYRTIVTLDRLAVCHMVYINTVAA